MLEGYWNRRVLGRRSLLRTGAVGTLGLAGAALVGCGDDDEATPTPGPGTPAPGNGTPEPTDTGHPYTGPRGGGFDPDVHSGRVEINTNPFVPGGKYIRNYALFPNVHDPHRSFFGSVHEYVNDRLLYLNGWTGEVVPDLLESLEAGDDGVTWVFTLRPDIYTHDRPPVDGRQFTAEDVSYSLRRMAGLLDPEAAEFYPRRSSLAGLNNVEAIDDLTVQLTFDRPNGIFLSALGDPRSQMIPMEQDDIGYDDITKAVGTGPFTIREFVEGSRILYDTNPNYFRKPEEGGRPLYDQYENLFLPDRAAELASFLSGQGHVIENPTREELAQLERSRSDAQVYSQPSNVIGVVGLNTRYEPFGDPRVRRAINLALPYQDLGEVSGRGYALGGVLHPLTPEGLPQPEILERLGYNPDTKQEAIQEANQLLDSAGYPNGAGLRIDYLLQSATGTAGEGPEITRDELTRAFPDLDLSFDIVGDFAAFGARQQAGEFHMMSSGFAQSPNAAIDASGFFRSDGSRNYWGFEGEYDDVLDSALTALTVEERQDLLYPLQRQMLDEGPAMMVTTVTNEQYHIDPHWAGHDLASGTWQYGIVYWGVGIRWLWQVEA